MQTVSGCDSLIITTTTWVQPVVDVGLDQSILVGDSVLLSLTTNLLPATISWQPSSSVACPTCLETLVFPATSTLFTVQIGDSSGCTVQGQVYVSVTDPYIIYRPNVFMPGSTLNEHFTIYTSDVQANQIRNLSIYDRWGESVFQKTNFPANVPALGWDGSVRGKPCSPGVYIYYLEVEWEDGRVSIYKGDVTLLR